MISDSLTELLL